MYEQLIKKKIKEEGEGPPSVEAIIVPSDQPIKEIVALMKKKQISSVLVHNDEEYVVGIITERDIVRKFTLLDMDDKLERTANTIMSRPISFVKVDNYQEEIIRLHLSRRFRHFPISNRKNPKIENILGIVSITDFLRLFIIDNDLANIEVSSTEKSPLCHIYIMSKHYDRISSNLSGLNALGVELVEVKRFEDFYRQYKEKPELERALLFDVDSYTVQQLKKLIPATRRYFGPLIIATENVSLAKAYKLHLNPEIQKILLRPIDISYCFWLLRFKWELTLAKS